MTGTTNDKPPTDARKRTLNDGDIATHPRRAGPSGSAPGTDADSHSDVDTDALAGAAKAASSDSDAASDKDT